MSNTMKAMIETRAYGLWEQEGRPEGRHEHHWLTAEQELAAKPKAKPPSKSKAKAKAA